MMIRLAAALALSLACLPVHGAGGAIDTTIGIEGVAPVIETVNDLNLVFARTPDGKFIVVRNTADAVVVMRRNADGTPDTTFGTAGQVTHARAAPVGSPLLIVPLAVERILFQGSKMLLAGEATAGCGTPGIARLNANGSVDATFGFRGWSTPVTPTRGIASCNFGTYFDIPEFRTLPDGRIMLVAQPFAREMLVAQDGDHIAVRWSANGEHDATYGGRGWVSGFPWYRTPGAARIFDDGSVTIVHGDLVPPGNVSRVRASRLSPSGQRSDSTLQEMQATTGIIPVAAVQNDGSVLLVRPGSVNQLLVSRYAGGAVDGRYGSGGTAAIAGPAGVRGVFPTPDSGVLIVTDSESAAVDGRNESIVFLKLDATGRPEPSFGLGGRADLSTSQLSEFPFQMTMEADGFLALYLHTSFRSGGDARYNFYFVRLQAVPDIVEFENAALRHYFIGYDNAEARGIDAGAAGPGWARTGLSFRPGGKSPVCRFYGTPGVGPNSHFYTADPDECELVKRDRGWTYEGIAFHVTTPTDGRCIPSTQRPVIRFYNNRAAQNDSNHRYLANEALAASMVAQGWILEGLVFCPPR